MKKLFDGTQVPSRCYYYLLDWRDYNLTRFIKTTGLDSVNELDSVSFWRLFIIASEEDIKTNCL